MAVRPSRETDILVVGGLGILSIAAIGLALSRGSGSNPSGGSNNPVSSSVSYVSVPPPECPGCGLYRYPNGATYAVDTDGHYYWIQSSAAFDGCGYSLSNVKDVDYGAVGGCLQGPNITTDCGTCPCTGILGLFDYCSDVPCPGCL